MKYKAKLIFADTGLGKTTLLKSFSPIDLSRFFEYPLVYLSHFKENSGLDIGKMIFDDIKTLIDAGVTVVSAFPGPLLPKLPGFGSMDMMYYHIGSLERMRQCCDDLLFRGDEKGSEIRKNPAFYDFMNSVVEEINLMNMNNLHVVGVPEGHYLSDYYDRETGEWSDESLISL